MRYDIKAPILICLNLFRFGNFKIYGITLLITKSKTMIKNWTVKTKQIKKKEKGFINYVNYLKDCNRPSHHNTRIVILSDRSSNILREVDKRKTHRKNSSLRGGGVSNYATSFVISLPNDIQQPTDQEWKKVGLYAIKTLSKTLNIDYEKLKELSHIVLHDESKNHDKHSHIHISVSNVVNNEVAKGISQYRSTYAMKQSVNRSVKHYLGVDHKLYSPKNKHKQNKPLWASKAEKYYRLENKLLMLENIYKNIKKDISTWSKIFLADIHLLAASKANELSNNINDLEIISTKSATVFDNIVEQIEIKKPEAPEQTKVSINRVRRRRKRN